MLPFCFSSTENHVDVTQNGANRIIRCTFYDLHNDQGNGGAILVNQADSQFYCTESQFHLCSAISSGGIHFSTSCANIDVSKICAVLCSSTKDYAFFAYLRSSSHLSCSLLSSHYCEGHRSTTAFSSKHQTISNVNSTHNKVMQEPSIFVTHFEFASVRFIEASSNEADTIGFNIHYGNYGFVSNLHYQNTTLTRTTSTFFIHVQFHLVTDGYLIDAYIDVSKSQTSDVIGIVNTSSLTLDNIFLLNSTKNNLNTEFTFFTSSTKTFHYTLLNTELCKAVISINNKCTRIERRASKSPIIFIIIILQESFE